MSLKILKREPTVVIHDWKTTPFSGMVETSLYTLDVVGFTFERGDEICEMYMCKEQNSSEPYSRKFYMDMRHRYNVARRAIVNA
jgi:hypothetical protein